MTEHFRFLTMVKSQYKVLVFGAGPVGLTVACVSAVKNKVYLYEADSAKRALLGQSKSHFYEPGLTELLSSGLASGNLEIVDRPEGEFLSLVDFVLVCVGTPTDPKTGLADTAGIESCLESLFRAGQFSGLAVIKSTVTVGFTESLSCKFGRPIVFCPEFLRQGQAIEDFRSPERAVFGLTSNCGQSEFLFLEGLFKTFVAPSSPIIRTSSESAELAKYASNLFLATKVSFANEVARLAGATGADHQEVLGIAGLDGRIGKQFLQPGLGFGGSCLPKDTRAWIAMAAKHSVPSRIASAAQNVNSDQISYAVDNLKQAYGQDLKNKTVGILGLAFKPNIDDTRESPGLRLARELLPIVGRVLACDPMVKSLTEPIGVEITDLVSVLAEADFLVVTTADQEWQKLNGFGFEGMVFYFASQFSDQGVARSLRKTA